MTMFRFTDNVTVTTEQYDIYLAVRVLFVHCREHTANHDATLQWRVIAIEFSGTGAPPPI